MIGIRGLFRVGVVAATCLSLTAVASASAPTATLQTDVGTVTLVPGVGCIAYVIPEPPGWRPGPCASLSSEVSTSVAMTKGTVVRVQFSEPVALGSLSIGAATGYMRVLTPTVSTPDAFQFVVPLDAPDEVVARFGANWSNATDRGDAYYGVVLKQPVIEPTVTVTRAGRRGDRLVVHLRATHAGSVRLRWRTQGRTKTKTLRVKANATRRATLAVSPATRTLKVTARLTAADGSTVTRSFRLRAR